MVRAGVAPDHQSTKRVTALFDRIARRRGFRFYLNVEVGKHLSHAELLAHHHAVIYASGAPNDRRLGLEGMGLPGTGTATEVVAWYNGHPEFADLPMDLSHERVVIIGNGNVALDVARVLTADPDKLAQTDIADHALKALRRSRVHEVVIAARRGPAQSAFTLPELIGLTATADIVLDAQDHELVQRDLAAAAKTLTRQKLEILSKLGDSSSPSSRPRIRLAYRLTPRRVLGRQRASGVEFCVTDTDRVCALEAGLVLTSIGYRGKPIRDLPFDEDAGVVPNDRAGSSTRHQADRCPAPTSRGGSSAGRPGSSAPTSPARSKPYSSSSTTSTPACSPSRSADRRHWTNSCGNVSPISWTPPDGRPSTPPRSPAAPPTDVPASSSPRSPTCWQPRRLRPRRRCGSGWSTGCANWLNAPLGPSLRRSPPC
ncbi:putative ferredoxin--NADP(+) reductase [Mycobacterium xenopi 3993]|nr:putative ferredoxin--NADP(+) reductase [Mycobacterium xenopi 3993]